MTRRPNNTFDDKTNTWLREHADDLKGIEGARHLKPNAESLDEDKKPPVDPPCTVCGRPIFDEFVDPKNSSYCTRPACKRKRAKLEKEQARLAHEKANPDGAAKSAAKAAAKATQRRAAREEKDIEADYDLEDGLGNVRDAVDDARGLEHKVFVEDPMEKDQAERDYKKEFGEDLRTSSTGREVFDDDDDDEFEEGADEEFDKSLEEKPEEVPEGTTTSVTKARPKVVKLHADGEGIVPIRSDFYDDGDVSLLARVRMGYRPDAPPRPDPALKGSTIEELKSCVPHGIAKCPTCFPINDAVIAFREQREKLRKLKEEQENDNYAWMVAQGLIIPPPKNEAEAMEQEAARILKERLKKEEMARRRIVRKPRPKRKPEETPNLRLRYHFTTRQVADVMDIPLFNKPFQVLDRSLMYDSNPETKTIFRKWFVQIAGDAEARGVPLRDGRRRGDARYEDVNRNQEQTEWEVIDGKPVVVSADYVAPVMIMVDGCACFVDPVDVAKEEPESADPLITRVPTPNKIYHKARVRTARLKSPYTYGDLVNMLPYRPEVMITPPERAFYKDYANRNMARKELEAKHGEKTDDEILLLENRAIKWAFKLNLLEVPFEEFEPDWERLLDEDIALEKLMISKTGGAHIGGTVHGGKKNRYGKTMKLNSFRTRPLPEEPSRGCGNSQSEGQWTPDYDDFGDESAA